MLDNDEVPLIRLLVTLSEDDDLIDGDLKLFRAKYVRHRYHLLLALYT